MNCSSLPAVLTRVVRADTSHNGSAHADSNLHRDKLKMHVTRHMGPGQRTVIPLL